MQIKYYKNWDASVSLVSKVEGGAGHGNILGPCPLYWSGYTVPMKVPKSWGAAPGFLHVPCACHS